MSAKFLWCASLASAVAGAFLVAFQGTAASPLPLLRTDLQVAVGACEAHGSLTKVSCELAADTCDADTGGECENDTWHGGCTGVNSPKPEGAGSEMHKEVQCENTYDGGTCRWSPLSGKCVVDETTSTGLTCGDKIGSDAC
jgi:hypothetical protein